MARRGEGRALLLCDFDKTLTDCDAGERLVGELAPELAPQLASLQMPANFVPLTNAVRACGQQVPLHQHAGRSECQGKNRVM